MANLSLIVSDSPETLETKVNQAIQAGNYLFGGLMVMPYDSLNRERFYQWVIDHQVNAARSRMTLVRADAAVTMTTRVKAALDSGKFLYGGTVIVPATSTLRERFFQWVSDDNINVRPSGPVSVDSITGISNAGKQIITADSMSAIVAMLGVTPGVNGREVELTATDDTIDWRYKGETTWRELLPLSEISGPGVQINIADGYIQWKRDDDSVWSRLISLEDLHGMDADQIELQATPDYIQWRYAGEEWVNLIARSELMGKSVELQSNGSSIQWRNTGDTAWTNLLALSAITGPAIEMRVSGGNIQWRVTGATTWNNLIATSALVGSPGPAIELQVNGGFIQWRVTGATTWNNLIAISALVGPANSLSIGNVTSGSPAAATITGTAPSQVLNLTIPGYSPQSPSSRTVAIGSSYQHTDTTKPFRVVANVRATQTLTVAGLSADKLELRVGPSAASVAPGGSGGFSVNVWESGITGIALMVGAGIQDGSSMVFDVPAGWYFQINRLAGTSAIVVSCFTQSMTA